MEVAEGGLLQVGCFPWWHLSLCDSSLDTVGGAETRMADSGWCQDPHILEGPPFYLWIPLSQWPPPSHHPSSVWRSRHTQELVSSGVFSQDRHLSCCSGIPAMYTFYGDVGERKNFACYVYLLWKCRRVGILLFPLMFCTWGLQIKLLTGENNLSAVWS